MSDCDEISDHLYVTNNVKISSTTENGCCLVQSTVDLVSAWTYSVSLNEEEEFMHASLR